MKLILVGDLHYPTLDPQELQALQIREQLYADFFAVLAQQPCDGYLFCGDLTNSGTPEDLQELMVLVRSLPAPTYLVAGNHDTHGCSKQEFFRITGLPPTGYYSADLADARLILLDTTLESCLDDWTGVLDDAQYRWLDEQMAGCVGRLPVVVAHHPVPDTTRRSDETKLQLGVDIRPILRRHSQGLYLNGHNHYHSAAFQNGWLFLQTGDFPSHLDYRVVELTGDRVCYDTHSLRHCLQGVRELSAKMQRYTLYTNLEYPDSELCWQGSLRERTEQHHA